MKPLLLGISFSNSLILVLKFVYLTSQLVSGILFSNFDLSASYLVFKANSLVSIQFAFATTLSYTASLTTSFFTTLLNLVNLTGTNLSVSNLTTSVFKLT